MVQLDRAGRNRHGAPGPRRATLAGCAITSLPVVGRPHPLYLFPLEADDDDQARRLIAAECPGEDLRLVQEEEGGNSVFGIRLLPVPRR
jgi:hypothetical protein